jgi:hypothetical protein
VAKGYVRVIVTTNFDRLIEQALSEAGVQASVISTPYAVQSALPLTHSPCTIIKIHGDYLDSRLRNTKLELSAYEKPFDDLLDRVFGEYGMVVCGWSAEWDVALRAVIERCAPPRFGTYWTAHLGKLTGQAEKLIGLRRATVLKITGADAFFQDLAEKLGALEDLTLSDPMSARVAVARMKRYLTSSDQRINLHDLVQSETERVHAGISGDRFSAKNQNISPEVTLRRLREYEAELNVLLPILACGAYWSTEAHFPILRRAVKRIADDYADQDGLIVWLGLRRYPALLTLYAMGIAAVANNNYGLLRHLLALQIRIDKHHPEESIIEPFSPTGVLDRNYQQQLLPGREREFTPLSNHVFAALRDPLRDCLPDEDAYDDAFDWFEYLIGLVHCDLTATPEEIDRVKIGPQNGHIRGPVGRFIWNKRTSDMGVQGRTHFEPGGPYPEVLTSVLQAGFFGSVGPYGSQLNYERFLLIKRGFDAHIALVRNRMGVW